MLFDTNRVDASKPIDLTQICNTGIYDLNPHSQQFGFQLKDEGIEHFNAKINIEVQHASELVIATIESFGGVIRTAYYDMHSVWAMRNTRKFFTKGSPIPKRMLPPQDAVAYYTDPKNRGYLADPEAISRERLVRICFDQLTRTETYSISICLSFYQRSWHRNTDTLCPKSKTIPNMIC